MLIRETTISRVNRAINYINMINSNNNIPLLILGGVTPWPTENAPPYPAESITQINDAQLAVPVTSIRLVYPSSTGFIQFDNKLYSYIPDLQSDLAFSHKATKVLVTTKFSINDISLFGRTFRVFGLTGKSSIKYGVVSPTAILSMNDINYYQLDTVITSSPITIQDSIVEVISFIKEF